MNYVRADFSENWILHDAAVDELKKLPDTKLLIVSFGLQGTSLRRLMQAQKHLVTRLGINANKVTTAYGGYEEGHRFELWFVPDNAETPEFKPQLPQTAYLSDWYSFNCEVCEAEEKDALKTIGQTLQENSDLKGYIIYEKDNDKDRRLSLKQVARYAQKGKNLIAKNYKIKPERIVVISNKLSNNGGISLWIVPKGAKPPKI